METISLDFIFKKNECPELTNKVDGEALMESLHKKFDSIKINWWGIFEDKLYIEDDIIFIVDAFNELISGFDVGEVQNIFLGDGSLQLTISFKEYDVCMEVQYAKFLDKNFIQKKILNIDKQEYICAWKSMVAYLIKLAK